jgi:hypothetical protein
MLGNIKVINLERSIERKSDFIKNNSNVDYEFVAGIDGHLLAENIISDKNYFIKPLPFYGKGAYGAALSHLKLWEMAIEQKTPITIALDIIIIFIHKLRKWSMFLCFISLSDTSTNCLLSSISFIIFSLIFLLTNHIILSIDSQNKKARDRVIIFWVLKIFLGRRWQLPMLICQPMFAGLDIFQY